MTIREHLEQPAKGDAGASPHHIDDARLQDTLKQTWGSLAEKPRQPADTASAHLGGLFQLAENKTGPAMQKDVSSDAREKVAMARRDEGSDSPMSPIAKAVVAEAQRGHEGKFSYMPKPGARYKPDHVPESLACAAAMSQVLINAHKDAGSPINYHKFYEVGVEKWANLYSRAGLVENIKGAPRSGDFILARNSGSGGHPHMGVLSKENGVMMVYHNQSGSMVREPLSESARFNAYGSKEYLRPR